MRLSADDRRILNCVQEDIPLSPEPFKIMSKRLGMKEKKLLEGLKRLKARGVIRNFAVRLNHKKLGFISSLIAIKIPKDKVNSTAKKISAYREVTHCYLREGEYNLWTVFICDEKKKQKAFLKKLTDIAGKGNIINLTTKKQFKLKTRFTL